MTKKSKVEQLHEDIELLKIDLHDVEYRINRLIHYRKNCENDLRRLRQQLKEHEPWVDNE